MHSTTAFPHSCSIASTRLFRTWNNDFVKEVARGHAFYSQGPCLGSVKIFCNTNGIKKPVQCTHHLNEMK